MKPLSGDTIEQLAVMLADEIVASAGTDVAFDATVFCAAVAGQFGIVDVTAFEVGLCAGMLGMYQAQRRIQSVDEDADA